MDIFSPAVLKNGSFPFPVPKFGSALLLPRRVIPPSWRAQELLILATKLGPPGSELSPLSLLPHHPPLGQVILRHLREQVPRVVSQPINAWLSLLKALLLRSVRVSGATAPAAAPLPGRGRAWGCPGPGWGSRGAQVSPVRQVRGGGRGAIPWSEPTEPRRGEPGPRRDPRAPSPLAARGSAAVHPSLPLSVSLR